MWLKNETKVTEYVNDVNGRVFQWGVTDCMSLYLNIASIITGDDSWLGIIDWDSEESALRTAKNNKPLEVLIRRGARRIKLIQTITSDIITGWCPHNRLPYAHTCVGRNFISSTPANGVFLTKRDIVLGEGMSFLNQPTAWRID